MVNTAFEFDDFVKAFKILARIGYKDVNETDSNKFLLISQYLRKNVNVLDKNPNMVMAEMSDPTK